MIKKTIILLFLLIIILLLPTLSIKPTINFDNTYYAQKISEALDTKIESGELIQSLKNKNGKTFFYSDSQLKTISIFYFEDGVLHYNGSMNYEVWKWKDHEGDPIEWIYHELENGESIIWGISLSDESIKINKKVRIQDFIQIDNGVNLFFTKNTQALKLPIEVKIENHQTE
ncbi:hypothetical protein ACQKMD_07565 [Viridibacillus sp. NPDC096237]|uniref:hypothetical protein n=1 Tax=Viridibacillus sp. NPDC096237 TaxID=3390721 RepID=UPI003CFD6DD5